MTRLSTKSILSPRQNDAKPKKQTQTLLADDAFAKLDEVTDMCKSALSPHKNPSNEIRYPQSSVFVRESPGKVIKSEVKFLNYNNINNNNANSSNNNSTKNSYNNNFKFNIDRKHLIELKSVPTESPIDFVSPRKGGDNSYTDYFDNLIALIDEAAKELSI